MARKVINNIERTNKTFIFREITLDSSMLLCSQSFRIKKATTTRRKGKKDPRAGATYLQHFNIQRILRFLKFRCLSSHRIVMVGLYGWTGK